MVLKKVALEGVFESPLSRLVNKLSKPSRWKGLKRINELLVGCEIDYTASDWKYCVAAGTANIVAIT